MKTGVLWLCALFALPAGAEVRAAAPALLEVQEVQTVAVPPARLFKDLGRIDRWWSSEHTFSGDARHLHLTLRADGLFSEEWKDGGVVHGRVVQWRRDKLLRLDAALGPFQSMAVRGVLTFALEPAGKGTKLTLTYRVSGDPSAALDKMAPIVDRMMGEQAERLKQFAETGKTPPVAQRAPAHP